MDSNEISNEIGNKKGKSNRLKLNTIFCLEVRSNWDKTIFSSRSSTFLLKMHRNEEERPKALLPVLQPQAARRHTFETPQNLGTFVVHCKSCDVYFVLLGLFCQTHGKDLMDHFSDIFGMKRCQL